MSFLNELRQQRWDDHRYYHHSRINQSLHLLSAGCFLVTYALVFVSPIAAAMIGWFLAMVSRQVGHFFFEPKGYDQINQATHEHKEDIKVGYNLFRKMILLSIWAASPLILHYQPSLFGLFEPHTSRNEFLYNLSLLWIYLGIGAVFFRMVQLYFKSGLITSLAWGTKIITDPFHDIRLYHKAPLHLMRGELYDPIIHEPQQHGEAEVR